MKSRMIPENTNSKLILQYSIKLLLLALSLGLIQSLLYEYVLADVVLYIPIWKVYTVLLLLALATYGVVLLTHWVIPEYTGFAFLASIIFKMFVSLWFLFPLIKSDFPNKTPDVLNFFLPFFIFVAVEAWLCIQVLKLKL